MQVIYFKQCHSNSPFSALELGVEGVPQAVAEQVQGKHHQRDGDGGNHQPIGVGAHAVEGIGGQTAKAGHGGVDAQTQEGQKALGKDGAGDLQSGGNDDHADAVGDQVLGDDPSGLGAGGTGSQHVFLLLEGSSNKFSKGFMQHSI